MDPVSASVTRTDFAEKVEGRSRFCADLRPPGLWYAATLRSTCSHAELLGVTLPVLPPGYVVVDRRDVTGKNRIPLVLPDQPFFAENEVRYVGEPILLLVGPDRDILRALLAQVQVRYRELPAVVTLAEAVRGNNPDWPAQPDQPPGCFVAYALDKGDPDKFIQSREPDRSDLFSTGWQEQAYLEPQSMLGEYRAEPEGKGMVTVSGSMQCPYYVKNALETALGWPKERVRVRQLPTGGGFGGKEEFPSLIGTHAGLAAIKSGHPVQLVYDRTEDMLCTTKRHPSRIRICSWLDGTGLVQAMDIDIVLDGGAYAGLSGVVLQRAMFTSTGVYRIPNLRVRGRVFATNTVPTGAFRGFGGPQAIFAMESHLCRLAAQLGQDAAEYRQRHFLHQGDTSSTGGVFHQPLALDHMAEVLRDMCAASPGRSPHLDDVGTGTDKSPVNGTGLLRGRGIAYFLHGCGFTGSGEQDLLKARVRLRKERTGEVRILVSSTEIGQGAATVLRKIVARSLRIPLGRVTYVWPDTELCPDSGPTVASRTTMVVGRLLEACACELGARMEEAEVELTREYADLVRPSSAREACRGAGLQIGECLPPLEWDNESFHGHAYPDYAWGANAVDVAVDPVTGEIRLEAVKGVFDVGTPIDERLLRGQIEGGMVQGLGHGSLEELSAADGRLRQLGFTNYILPTAMDVPQVESRLVSNPNTRGPYGARGAGELTLVGAATALALAVSDAIGKPVDSLPVTPETVLSLLRPPERS